MIDEQFLAWGPVADDLACLQNGQGCSLKICRAEHVKTCHLLGREQGQESSSNPAHATKGAKSPNCLLVAHRSIKKIV